MNTEKHSKATAQRLGIIIFVVLAVFTAVEFWVSVSLASPGLLLTIIALIKAGLIIHYFMHLSQVWRKEAQS